MTRLLRFKLCGLDLSDSFEALNTVLALVKGSSIGNTEPATSV